MSVSAVGRDSFEGGLPIAARDQQMLLAGLAWLAPDGGDRRYGGTLFDAIGRYHATYSVAAR